MPTKITRREFVSTSTAAGLALGAAPVFGQAGRRSGPGASDARW